jgi:hypothetical protein
MEWAERSGEANDYTDNLPLQCLHPVGHWYEIPNLFRNGVLQQLLSVRPQLKHILVHNIDTMGVHLDPTILGYHMQSEAGMTVEVITRWLDDRGGGLARTDTAPADRGLTRAKLGSSLVLQLRHLLDRSRSDVESVRTPPG